MNNKHHMCPIRIEVEGQLFNTYYYFMEMVVDSQYVFTQYEN